MKKLPLYMTTQLNHINIILSKKRQNTSVMTNSGCLWGGTGSDKRRGDVTGRGVRGQWLNWYYVLFVKCIELYIYVYICYPHKNV